MPVFACRWPNGDLSFVHANNRQAALRMLDEIAEVEDDMLMRVNDFMVNLALTPEGSFELDESDSGAFNDQTYKIIDKLYPAISAAYADPVASKEDPELRERLKAAAEIERTRDPRNGTIGRPPWRGNTDVQ